MGCQLFGRGTGRMEDPHRLLVHLHALPRIDVLVGGRPYDRMHERKRFARNQNSGRGQRRSPLGCAVYVNARETGGKGKLRVLVQHRDALGQADGSLVHE